MYLKVEAFQLGCGLEKLPSPTSDFSSFFFLLVVCSTRVVVVVVVVKALESRLLGE